MNGARPRVSVQVETSGVTTALMGEYAALSIAFEVTAVLTARPCRDSAGFELTEHPVSPSYPKDYDAIGERPTDWSRRFDTSQWALFLARRDGRCLGGAAVAVRTPECDVPERRDDIAVLWDIRVVPAFRGEGVGRALFETAETWARAHDCRELKVETQNVNVAACRFYAAMGCELRVVREDAYPLCPGEAQFLWYKSLCASDWLTAGTRPRV